MKSIIHYCPEPGDVIERNGYQGIILKVGQYYLTYKPYLSIKWNTPDENHECCINNWHWDEKEEVWIADD